MNIFPKESETLVLANSRDETILRVALELQDDVVPGVTRRVTGWLENDRFQLTIRLRRHHMFMPVVSGVIERTSKGSIVFLTYSLFASTRLLLMFWTVLLPLVGIIITIQQDNIWVFVGTIMAALSFLAIAWSNFKLHVKNTRELVHQMLQA